MGLFNGPNSDANLDRRASLASRANDAANLLEAGDKQGALDELNSLLRKIDDESPPPDWMDDSPEKTDLANQVTDLITLIEISL